MKSLILTESEKNRILGMHNPNKTTVNEGTAEELQQLLNDTFKAGLTVDGKIGPKTIAAIEKALGTGSTNQSTTQTNTQPAKPSGDVTATDTKGGAQPLTPGAI